MADDPSTSQSKLDFAQIMRHSFDDANKRLRVGADINATVGDMNIDITAASGDNIAIASQDGANTLNINSDGSINVNFITSGLTTKNIFNEVSSVASGVTTTVVSYTATPGTKLLKVDMGGGNVASYSLSIGGVLQNKKYTYYQNLNEIMDFKAGLPLNAGDQIVLSVIHTRPDPADFNAAILIEN